ncbi:cell division protein FtsL [Breznakia pachnodae]|uniref:Cell division protein FtsL n=1 Tax=Breznakia pachnodae TaxID=265178 RepID=A0ABU0E5P7_9FIRM|nr:cell division protein FtsL [Breznakia pachnodae]MDQ0362221.1 cell division protein FtsL [Breznakia pachnodae]
MVKIVKKKRKLRIEGLISLIFVISILCYFGSVTILRSQNVVKQTQLGEIENDIELLDSDVANLTLEVKQLDSRDRILEIAEKHGLTVRQEQIVSVTGTE